MHVNDVHELVIRSPWSFVQYISRMYPVYRPGHKTLVRSITASVQSCIRIVPACGNEYRSSLTIFHSI